MPEGTPPRRDLPAKIGRYRIVERIGRGGMGVVYAAEDEMMGRPVALKVLIADLENDPETRVRFYREAQAAARLVHPNIITIFDLGEDRGRSYIAMQLLEGWPLAAYLKQPEAAPLERKLDLMVQVCEGLATAHARGVVHRDLKPGNLFVQRDGLLKILDFGVARLADSSMTAAGVMLGTPDYMSPEQARGTAVDARSDIFSAAAVFYFMLTGRKPFPGPGLPAVLHQLQFEPPAPIADSDAPQELAGIVLQAIEKEPDARPPRVQELAAALVRFRRRYQTETRSVAASARAQYDIVASLVTALAEAGTALGLPPDSSESAVLANLRQRFPALAQRGGAALETAPLDRRGVVSVLHDLEGERQRLAEETDARREHIAVLDAGQRALDAGDAREALRQCERVVAAFPTASRALALAESCRPLAREQEQRETRAAAEAAAVLQQLTAEEIRRARSIFSRGRYQDALQDLQALVDAEPSAHEARAELERLDALRQDLETRRGRAGELLACARSLAEKGQPEEALTRAREALRIDPGDADAAALCDELLARDLEQRVAREQSRTRAKRASEAEPLMAAAREDLARGYLALAASAADAACRIAPDRADAAALAAEIHALMTSQDQVVMADAGDTLVVARVETSHEQSASPATPAATSTDRGGDLAQVDNGAADRLPGGHAN